MNAQTARDMAKAKTEAARLMALGWAMGGHKDGLPTPYFGRYAVAAPGVGLWTGRIYVTRHRADTECARANRLTLRHVASGAPSTLYQVVAL